MAELEAGKSDALKKLSGRDVPVSPLQLGERPLDFLPAPYRHPRRRIPYLLGDNKDLNPVPVEL